MQLENKVALITGGSRGIGFAVAQAFLAEGARVAICGSRIQTAEHAVTLCRERFPKAEVLAFGLDAADSTEIARVTEEIARRWGGIDVLVNNAGITAAQPVTKISDEEFDTMLRVNLVAPFRWIRAVAKSMEARGGGSIINTASVVGVYGGRMQASYSASKAGVIGLTRACAKELGVSNIRVNAVAPGVVETDMVGSAVGEAQRAALRAATPLGRTASPEELTGIYVYLASERSSFTTGAVIQVDGGIVM